MFIGSLIIWNTFIAGFNDAYGSWKMICIRFLYSFSSLSFKLAMSFPSNKTLPEVTSCKRMMLLPVVDFPQPDSPTSPNVSPFLIVKLRSSTAFNCSVFLPNGPFLIGKYFLSSALQLSFLHACESPTALSFNQHMERLPSPISKYGGRSFSQMSIACGQRSANGQPFGGCNKFGVTP